MYIINKLLLFSFLFVGLMARAQGVIETFDYTHLTSTDKVGEHCQLAFSVGSGKSNPTLLSTSHAVSFYLGNRLTIESHSKKCITKVVLHAAESGKSYNAAQFASSSGYFRQEEQAWIGQSRQMDLVNISLEVLKISRIEVHLADVAPKQITTIRFAESTYDIFEGDALPSPILEGVNAADAAGKLAFVSGNKNVLDLNADGTKAMPISTGETKLTVIYLGDEQHAPCMSSCWIRCWKDVREVSSIRDFNVLADEINVSRLVLNAAEVVQVTTNSAFISDGTSCLALRFSHHPVLEAGDVLTGTVLGRFIRNSYPALLVENNAINHLRIEHKSVSSPQEVDCIKLTLGNCVYGHQVNVIAKVINPKKHTMRLTVNGYDLKIDDVLKTKLVLPKEDACLGLTGLFYSYEEGTIFFTPLNRYGLSREMVLDEYKSENPVYSTSSTTVVVKRKLKAGRWNSICLPIAMDKIDLQRAFGNHTLVAFSSVSGNKLLFKSVDRLDAGVPYLLKTNNAIDSWTLPNVSIDAPNANKITHEGVSFCGTYNVKELVSDGTEQFLRDNKLFIPAKNKRVMPGLRAYFEFPSAAGAKQFDFVIDETSPIVLPNFEEHSENADVWFTLDGKAINPQHRQLGHIYVRKNKKFIVR